MSNVGAPASYRGYRLQALYVMYRILCADTNLSLEYFPERHEDLDIDENGILIEAIQVKSSPELNISTLLNQAKKSFFHRVTKFKDNKVSPQVMLVNFGSFSKEMQDAWRGNELSREKIAIKFKERGIEENSIEYLFDTIILKEVHEEDIKQKLFAKLRELITGIDVEISFDILQKWIYDVSEKRTRITSVDIIEKIQKIGKYLSERYHHHKEWFTTIVPLEDDCLEEEKVPALRKEFYAGVSARYEHILAGLDFLRENKMLELQKAFEETNVVILHASSGQGKSTLCLRYLHDMFPSGWRFYAKSIDNSQTALSVAAALAGHAKAVQMPVMLLIDVMPSDTEWHKLAQELSRNKFIQVLVAIREEDFQRTLVSSSFEYKTIDLSFKEEEARTIFKRVTEMGFPSGYLNFEDAWLRFGGKGPLMEFVFLLTQTDTLRRRLEEQVKRIRLDVSSNKAAPDILALLRLASVGTAHETRVLISDLVSTLSLPDPAFTLSFFENEYLLKVSSDKKYITALHPIRSQILTELLTDKFIVPWIDEFNKVIRFIPEDDLELFILNAFYFHSEIFDEIVSSVLNLTPGNWVGVAGVLRCLIWAGIREYLNENEGVFKRARELCGSGWYIFVNINFVDDKHLQTESIWNELRVILPETKRTELNHNRAKQTSSERTMLKPKLWISRQKQNISTPKLIKEWASLAEVVYWISQWKIPSSFIQELDKDNLFEAFKNTPLQNIADFVFAFYMADPLECIKWLEAKKNLLERRIADELNIVALTESSGTLFIHFLIDYEGNTRNGKKRSIHDKTIEKIKIIRRLYPQYDSYGSQGYGHKLTFIDAIDDTYKPGIDKNHLPPDWPIKFNNIAIGLENYKYRSESWGEYLSKVIQIRSLVVQCLAQMNLGISRYFSNQKPLDILKMKIFSDGTWDRCYELIKNMPLLPKQAVDYWGVLHPEDGSNVDLSNYEKLAKTTLANEFKEYNKEEQSFYRTLTKIFEILPDVFIIQYKIGKLPENSNEKTSYIDFLSKNKIKIDSLRIAQNQANNISRGLKTYQSKFRELFSSSVNNIELENLEDMEKTTITDSWQLLYYFINHSRWSFDNPKEQITNEINKLLRQIYDDLEKVEKDTAALGIKRIPLI